MFNSILVVCIGNICRSPAGERFLHTGLPGKTVASAGLGALVGHGADADAAEAAAAHGVSLDNHSARQFTPELAGKYDLILVMEPDHRTEIIRQAPHLSGKTMLFDQWSGARGIADPYRKSPEFHAHVMTEIARAADAWIAKLNRTTQ